MIFKNKIKVAPSILSADYADLKNEIEKGNPLANDKNYKDSLFCEGLAIQYIRENLEN